MTARAPAIVFDLDGTLVDSAPDIHAAVNRTLAAHGHAPLALATVKRFIGNGVPVLIERVMDARAIPAVDGRHARLTRSFEGFYGEAPAALTRPYPGVVEAVGALRAAGCALGVCTNKPASLAHAILAALGLDTAFGAVIGGDSLPVRKPDPLPLLAARRALGDGPCVYVGDSEVDADTAARAGLPFLLFRGGYARVPLAEVPCTAAFDAFAELPRLLAALEPARPEPST
jgi:phosphoglycolate phosphatase